MNKTFVSPHEILILILASPYGIMTHSSAYFNAILQSATNKENALLIWHFKGHLTTGADGRSYKSMPYALSLASPTAWHKMKIQPKQGFSHIEKHQ